MSRADRSRLPSVAITPGFQFPPIVKQRLQSGLNAWCVEQHTLPLISFLLVLPTGSASDPEPLPGLASLTGDMLDEGSGGRSAIEVHEAFSRLGAHLEIEVAADVTTVGLTVLSRFAPLALSLLADCCVRPSLREADVERIRQLRLNRLAQLRDLAPAVADRAFMETLYGRHPYGHLAIGNESALRKITQADVVSFHAAAFLAERATLVAVGDIGADDLLRLVAEAFGAWTREVGAGPPIEFDAALEDPSTSVESRLAIVHREHAAQSELRIGHVGVARRTPDYVPLLVLNMVLGGQFVSRINMKLREEKGYTYGARTSFDFRRGRGPFLLQTSVQTPRTAEAIQDVFDELNGIRGDRPVAENELELAKSALTLGYARNFETTEQLARALAQLVIHDLPDDYYDRFPEQVKRVDLAEVTRAATVHLRPERALTLVVGDQVALEASLGSIGIGAPTVLAPA